MKTKSRKAGFSNAPKVLVAFFWLFYVSLFAQEWRPVPGHIMTRWAAKVDPQAPLPEYPRPQMVRPDWINLNGLWDYSIQPLDGSAPEQYDGKILVPFPIESALSGLRKPLTKTQRLWYHRFFKAPSLAGGKHLLLHFGAVDWETKAIVNGKPVGEHRGGYDPFTFDVTDATIPGETNELIVCVFDPTGSYQPKGKQNFNKFAKPGGIAYTPCSGIWQTVWLEPVAAHYIQSVKITPDVKAGFLHLEVIASDANDTEIVRATASDEKKIIGNAVGRPNHELICPMEHAKLWSPDTPNLYTLKIQLGDDAVSCYFAMREISIGKDENNLTRMLLNGKFVFQSGPLDQGYWPDGIYTAPTDEALRFDIEEMKKLGFNMVRKHLKVEPERWYYWCDKLGLLVWQDMPNGDGGKAVSKEHDGVVNTPEAAREFEIELKAMIETHYDHPCIVVWTIFNEGWGQYDVPRLTAWAKKLDPSRLVNSTSGWHDQHVGDLVDAHSYPGPVCPQPETARAAVLGEYGGLGLVIPGHSWVEAASWGYRSTSGSKELTRKYLDLWRQVWSLKDSPGLCASVYTQLTDVETECNGLLSYDREVEKVNVSLVADAQHGKIAPPMQYRVIAPTGQITPVSWRYTFEKPADSWLDSSFDDSNWKEGAAGFGDGRFTKGLVRTQWETEDIWLRRRIVLPEVNIHDLALSVLHAGAAEVYLNGVLALSSGGSNSGYDEMDIRREAENTMRAGPNLICVHCHKAKDAQHIDVGLAIEEHKDNQTSQN